MNNFMVCFLVDYDGRQVVEPFEVMAKNGKMAILELAKQLNNMPYFWRRILDYEVFDLDRYMGEMDMSKDEILDLAKDYLYLD